MVAACNSAPTLTIAPAPGATLETFPLHVHQRWPIEECYQQVKDELGWADFQVRSGTAIRRHQALVNCAF